MGSFAKSLGQLSRASLETESANILKTAAANKVGLSKALDATLRQGHDMRAFGLGTVASMASVARYANFTASMRAVYGTMEARLDAAPPGSANALVWRRHGDVLRRFDRLDADLRDVAAEAPALSPATGDYVAAVDAAADADEADSGGRMLGHLYCRYFADLFGGSMLAAPYNLALGLPAGTPRHYAFEFAGTRRDFIEDVYASLNDAGAGVDHAVVTAEALVAFRRNVDVYTEEPVALDAARGAANLVAGGARRVFAARP